LVRFAVISDIHANLSALQAALHAIEAEEEPVDRVICAGDTVGRGPHPNEVLGLLRDKTVEVVRGNYDDAVAYDRIGSGVDFADAAAEAADQQAVAWTRRTITPQNLEYLRQLPKDVRLFPLPSGIRVKRDELRKRQSEYGRSLFRRAIFGSLYRPAPERIKRILVVHGSPRALNERVTSETATSILEAIAREAQTELLISAHAGAGFMRHAAGMAFIGVGPLSGPHVRAGTGEFALVDVRGNEPVVEFARVEYDPAEHLGAMESHGLPSYSPLASMESLNGYKI
jgi:predicted phosphodiesterase